MYRIALIPLLAVLLIASGCTGDNSPRQKTDELAELRSQVSSLQQQLSSVTDERDSLRIKLRMANVSLTEALTDNEALTQRAKDAETQLVYARTEFKKSFAAFDATLKDYLAARDDYADDSFRLSVDNGKLRDTISLQAGEISQLNKTLDATQQWRGHYKKISERSIFKHLFRAGKPPLPDVQDPGD